MIKKILFLGASILLLSGAFFVCLPIGAVHAVDPVSPGTGKNSPTPNISTISPISVVAGSPQITLDIRGNNFILSSQATFNGQNVFTTIISPQQVQALITADKLVTAGSFPVRIVNSATEGGPSNTLNFTVTPAAPKIPPSVTGLFPLSMIVDSGPVAGLAVSGTNFTSPSTVEFFSIPFAPVSFTIPPASLTANQITVSKAQLDTLAVGTFYVTVKSSVAGGGSSTAQQRFTVNPKPTPLITIAVPATAMVNAPTTIQTTFAGGSVAANGNQNATGNIIYTVYSNSGCSANAQPQRTNPVSFGVSNFAHTFTTQTANPTTYFWRASYSGDINNSPAVSNCVQQTVSPMPRKKAVITLNLNPGNNIALPVGTSVFATPTLLADGLTTTATGTVTYTIYTSNNNASNLCNTVVEAETKPVANGFVPNSKIIPYTRPGTYYYQAVYSGDLFYEPSTSPCNEFSSTYVKILPPNSLSVTLDISPTTVAINALVPMTTRITGLNANDRGTIAYMVYTTSAACSAGLFPPNGELLGEKPATEGQQNPVFAFPFIRDGKYFIRAIHPGNIYNNKAMSQCVELTVSPKTIPAISLVLNPVSPVIAGTNVRGVASLTNAQGATGNVTYRVFTNLACTLPASALDTKPITNGTVDPSSPVLFTNVNPTTGTNTFYWKAVYSGDANFATVSSNCEALVVNAVVPPNPPPVVQPPVIPPPPPPVTPVNPPVQPSPTTGSLKIIVNSINGGGTFNYTSSILGTVIPPLMPTSVNFFRDETTISGITPGTAYAITQNANLVAGWTLTTATCNFGGVKNGNTLTAVAIVNNQTTTCTFTNTFTPPPPPVVEPPVIPNPPITTPPTPATGTLRFVKNTVNRPVGEFRYITGGFRLNQNPLTTAAVTATTGAASQNITVPAATGAYSISENQVPAGWTFTSAECKLQNGASTGTAMGESVVNITVNANQTTTCTFVNTFTVPSSEPEPAITSIPVIISITPPAKSLCEDAQTLTVTGSNFSTNSKIHFGALSVQTDTSQASAGILTTPVTQTPEGEHKVTVVNPGAQGGTSQSRTFTVTTEAGEGTNPVVTGISPTAKKSTEAGFTLTVNGSGFEPGSKVLFNNYDKTTKFISENQLTAVIPSSSFTKGGVYEVVVINPAPQTPGCQQEISNAQQFTVNGSDTNPSGTTNPVPDVYFQVPPEKAR